MIEEKNIEEFFDVVNEGCVFLFNKKKTNYLEGLLTFTNNLLDENTIEFDDEEYLDLLKKLNKEYHKEEVRKALQYLILNAFKEIKYENTITPDSIALFFSYLVDKLYGKKEIAILDPMIGSGNLLMAIANQRENSILFGIDIEETMIKLSKMMADMLNETVNLFFQDTLSVRLTNMDLIVCDIPCDNLLAYKTISYHLNSLKNGGYMLLLIGDEFFTDINIELKKQIEEVSTMQGIIQLPNEFFKNKTKSIVLIQKNKEPINDFLIAAMPSIKDHEAMNSFLIKIGSWFSKGGNKKC